MFLLSILNKNWINKIDVLKCFIKKKYLIHIFFDNLSYFSLNNSFKFGKLESTKDFLFKISIILQESVVSFLIKFNKSYLILVE